MAELKIFQRGFNYGQDGPGNRLVIHLTGCNLRCPWCSNPEGMSFSAPGETVGADELAGQIISCRAMFFDGGGVTFTGGEPSLRAEALIPVLVQLRDAGIDRAIETNASVASLPSLYPYLSRLIADFKNADAEALRRVTGADLSVVKTNLLAAKLPLSVRIPLIHGFNDSEANAAASADFLSTLTAPGLTVELLPYHEYGRAKYDRLGIEYTVKDGFVSAPEVARLEEIFRSHGLCVIHS